MGTRSSASNPQSFDVDGNLMVTPMGPGGATAVGPVAYVQPAWVATNAAAPTDILAAGLAENSLTIINNHASEPANIRFDGSDATSAHGLSLAAGKGVSFDRPPTGKISAYTANVGSIYVDYA